MELFHHWHPKKAIPLVLLAWLLFSSMSLFSKLSGPETTVATQAFFRNLLGLVLVAPWMVKHHQFSFRPTRFDLILVRSISGLMNLVFIFLAVQKTSLINVSLLNNTAPFIIPFLVWLWLKQPINHKLWPGIVIGFVGILCILQPSENVLNLGGLYALAGGLCLAVSTLTMRLATKTEPFFTVLFYFFFIGFVLTLPAALMDWKIASWKAFWLLVGISASSALGQLVFFKALQYGKASILAPFGYASILFGAFYDWLFWNKIPNVLAFCGAALVILGGLLVIHFTKTPRTPSPN